jgi:hypothetical protein
LPDEARTADPGRGIPLVNVDAMTACAVQSRNCPGPAWIDFDGGGAQALFRACCSSPECPAPASHRAPCLGRHGPGTASTPTPTCSRLCPRRAWSKANIPVAVGMDVRSRGFDQDTSS